jgi:glycosyltransferase involved in cell wall biosynthesis
MLNIVECHLEFGGFDDRLIKGGISVYLWNLCGEFAAAGHRVTAVTAAHGLLPWLRERYDVEDLPWAPELEIPVALDPRVWPDHAPEVVLDTRATAHRIRVRGVDIVVLAGGLLDSWPETFYPPYESKGRDLRFLKPLVFQVCAANFIAEHCAPNTVVHLHEPYYHYLMPSALSARQFTVVSTVQANMPVSKKVYGPEVRTLLTYLEVDLDVARGMRDAPLTGHLRQVMRAYLPRTLLYNDYPERPGHDYLPILGLVVRSVAALDFLSPGQLDHVISQRGTPFERLFSDLAVHRELRAAPERLVVGGCAIGDRWRTAPDESEPREATLNGLGLDPERPTLYHNARYAPGHKGQHELFRALLRVLEEGTQVNVLLHCLDPGGTNDPGLTALGERFTGLVRISTQPMAEQELIEWACSSDICVYPSKYEMDTFLMAMGEAMACGAVPLATAQLGMAHFGHSATLTDPAATGLALPRSFRADDRLLEDAIVRGIHTLLEFRAADPQRWSAMRDRARRVARTFSWQRAATRLAGIFEAASRGGLPRHPAAGTPGLAAGEPAHGTEPRWVGADAARVEAVWLAADGGVEARQLPVDPDGVPVIPFPVAGTNEIALLITMKDGRSVWDTVRIDSRQVR